MLKPILQYRPEDRGFLLCLPGPADGGAWQRVLRGLPGNLQGRERLTPAKARVFLADSSLLELHSVPLRWQRALPWLASLPPAAEGSLAFWGAALRLLQSLVIRGALLPTLETEASPWRARWSISLTSPADRKAMERLAAAMPPAVVAYPEGDNWMFTKGLNLGALEPFEVEDDLALPPRPADVLQAFLEDGADFVMRFVAGTLRPGEDPRLAVIHRLRGHKRDRLPWDERILVALSHPMSEFPTVGVTERTLGEQLGQWSEGARDPWVRPSFTLEAPPVPPEKAIQEADRLSEAGWLLRVGLETAGGQRIGVDRLWEASTEPVVLQARQVLLRGLARAVPFFPPLEGALAGQRPEDFTLKPTEAWLFLTRGAGQLKEAGFLVEYPEELAEFGGARRLRAKVRLGARRVEGDAEAAGGQAGLEGSVSADWSLMLGDDKLEIEDFAQMASLKHPLVAWKGKWIALDPDTLQQITQVIQASRGAGFESMTKGEALAAALTGTARIPGVSEAIEVEVAGDFGQALAELRHLPDRPIKQPSGFRGQLRPYQVRGLAWLDGLARLGLGGILADDMGLGKCVGPESKVHVNGSLQRIAGLWDRYATQCEPDGEGEWATPAVTLQVNALDEATGKMVLRPVRRMYRQLVRERVRQVTLEDGSRILLTRRHQLRSLDGWTRNLQVGLPVAVPARLVHEGPGADLDLARFLAWQIAEGHEPGNAGVFAVTQDDRELLGGLRECLLRIGERYGLKINQPRVVDAPGKSSYLRVSSVEYRRHLEQLGYRWGQRSRGKAIPDFLVAADAGTIRVFLRNYFDAEASVVPSMASIEISSASRLLMDQLSAMLRRFGIWMRISTKQKRATNGKGIYREYAIGVIGGESLRRFAREIGFGHAEKTTRLLEIAAVDANTNVEGIAAQGIVRRMVNRSRLPLRHFGMHSTVYIDGSQGFSRTSLGRVATHAARILSGTAEREYRSLPRSKWTQRTLAAYRDLDRDLLQTDLEEIQRLVEGEFHFCPIRSIEDLDYEGWVYDLEVEEHHNFVAEGMICHNTIEIIALLLHRQQLSPTHGPTTLLICPTSLLGNWERELAKFSPSIPFFVHHGNNRDPLPAAFRPHTVVLTTYGVVRREEETFAARTWGLVVVDEAQAIKNAGSAQAKAVRRTKGHVKVALTGTPIENRLLELWSIMGSALPGYLASESAFKERFATPIEKYRDADAAAELRQRVGPFILRRLKTDKSIIQDLPEKQEMKVYTSLTREQAMLYQARVDQMDQDLAKASGIERRGRILALLTHLKQICNHPSHFLRQQGPYAARSGKLDRLTEMLEEVLESGERALVFTQFKEMGDRLQVHLQEALGFEPPFLHGGTSRKDRDELVRGFQEDPSFAPVFLLSLKAGGVGLNLTAATHVFHYDRWWNPAVEDQATDRTYRIGQTRNVQVHKLITIGTLEEKIDLLLESKRDLADRVVGTGEGWLTELDDEALRRLVSLDADAEIMDADEAAPGADQVRRAVQRAAAEPPEVEDGVPATMPNGAVPVERPRRRAARPAIRKGTIG